jgi:hypothetical protein
MVDIPLENPAAVEAIERTISGSESIVTAAKGAKGSGKNRAAFVLTNQRLIRYKKDVLSESTDTYRLERITSVNYEKSPFKRLFSIHGSGLDEEFGLHPDSNPEEFVNSIREQIAD